MKFSWVSFIECSQGIHKEIETCCSISKPCTVGQGHCDSDSDCLGSLVCGSNNCDRRKFPSTLTDCCTNSGSKLI